MLSFWKRESIAPISWRMFVAFSLFSTTNTFAPASAAVIAAIQPPVPQPATNTSVSIVSVISVSAISGAVPSQSAFTAASSTATFCPLACEIQSAAAFLIASAVTVAPETPSTLQLCAASIFSRISSTIFPPISGVSPDASIWISVMLVSSNVIVTVTSPLIPFAEAVYVPGV